jgi:hypothetical protein
MDKLKKLLSDLEEFNKLTVLGEDVNAVTEEMGTRYIIDEEEQGAIELTISALSDIITMSEKKLNYTLCKNCNKSSMKDSEGNYKGKCNYCGC